jgi:hypothetical protein
MRVLKRPSLGVTLEDVLKVRRVWNSLMSFLSDQGRGNLHRSSRSGMRLAARPSMLQVAFYDQNLWQWLLTYLDISSMCCVALLNRHTLTRTHHVKLGFCPSPCILQHTLADTRELWLHFIQKGYASTRNVVDDSSVVRLDQWQRRPCCITYDLQVWFLTAASAMTVVLPSGFSKLVLRVAGANRGTQGHSTPLLARTLYVVSQDGQPVSNLTILTSEDITTIQVDASVVDKNTHIQLYPRSEHQFLRQILTLVLPPELQRLKGIDLTVDTAKELALCGPTQLYIQDLRLGCGTWQSQSTLLRIEHLTLTRPEAVLKSSVDKMHRCEVQELTISSYDGDMFIPPCVRTLALIFCHIHSLSADSVLDLYLNNCTLQRDTRRLYLSPNLTHLRVRTSLCARPVITIDASRWQPANMPTLHLDLYSMQDLKFVYPHSEHRSDADRMFPCVSVSLSSFSRIASHAHAALMRECHTFQTPQLIIVVSCGQGELPPRLPGSFDVIRHVVLKVCRNHAIERMTPPLTMVDPRYACVVEFEENNHYVCDYCVYTESIQLRRHAPRLLGSVVRVCDML